MKNFLVALITGKFCSWSVDARFFLRIAKITIFIILTGGGLLTAIVIRAHLQNLLGQIGIGIGTWALISPLFYSWLGFTVLYVISKFYVDKTWEKKLMEQIDQQGSILGYKFFHGSFYFLSDLIMDFWFLYRNRSLRFKTITTGSIIIWWYLHLFTWFMLSMVTVVFCYLFWDIAALLTAWVFRQELVIQIDLNEYNSFFLTIPQCLRFLTKIPHVYAFLILYTVLSRSGKTLSKDLIFRMCYYRLLGIPLSLIWFLLWNVQFCDLLIHRLNPTRKNPRKWWSILKYEFKTQFPIELNKKFSLLIKAVASMRILTDGRKIWTNPNKYIEYETVLTGKMAYDILTGRMLNASDFELHQVKIPKPQRPHFAIGPKIGFGWNIQRVLSHAWGIPYQTSTGESLKFPPSEFQPEMVGMETGRPQNFFNTILNRDSFIHEPHLQSCFRENNLNHLGDLNSFNIQSMLGLQIEFAEKGDMELLRQGGHLKEKIWYSQIPKAEMASSSIIMVEENFWGCDATYEALIRSWHPTMTLGEVKELNTRCKVGAMLKPYDALTYLAVKYLDKIGDLKGKREFLELLATQEKMNIRE